MESTPERPRMTVADVAGTARSPGDEAHRLELVEEELQTRKTSVQTGVVRIRTQVVSETRTIQVVVRREEVIIEHHPVEPQAADGPQETTEAHLFTSEAAQIRDLQPGETIRIPLIEEEVVVQTRPVVVEEVVVGKRLIEQTQTVSASVRREQARIQATDDVEMGGQPAHHAVRVKPDRGPRTAQ